MASVRALDTGNDIPNSGWFTDAYSEGFRLYVAAGTMWEQNTPRTNLETWFGWALSAGLKIGVYTRHPDWYQTGLTAAGTHKSDLLFFAFDVETDPGTMVQRSWINDVSDQGVQPIIYTGWGMWPDISGNSTAFADVPLWDTDTSGTIDYATWVADLDYPTPVAYGGWNGANDRPHHRIGVQQKFEYTLNGVNVDLNSFDSTFLDKSKLLAAQHVVATAISGTEIDVTWNAAYGATGYDIERDSSVIATDHPASPYHDSGLGIGTPHTYRVRSAKTG